MAQILFDTVVTSPPAPSAGMLSLFAKADGTLWKKLPDGSEIPVDNEGFALLDSPVFIGDPRAPTPPTTDNDTSLATTAFTHNAVGTLRPYATNNPTMDGVANPGSAPEVSRGDHTHPSDTSRSPVGHGHPATAITYTPSGNIQADNVQNAIMELDQEKAKLGVAVPLMNGVGSAGSDTDEASRQDHVHPSDTTKANLSYVNAQDAALAADIATLANDVATADAFNVKKTSNTGTANLPAGTDAQRDVAPQVGAIRFSSTQLGWEGWNGVNWVSIGGGQMLGNALVKGIFYNAITIAENVTVKAGTNGLSAGEIQVASGFEVTVENGSTWSVV